MNRTLMGALIIVALAVVGAVGAKLLLPLVASSRQKATTDAVKTRGRVRVAVDSWIGYGILNSPEMEAAMRRAGYLLQCEDDSADYRRRMERLEKGEIDFAVATVDSFLLNAAPLGFPGAVVMVIDASKGGDAILARKERVASLDGIRGRNDIRVAFTPNSPSHHLAKAAAHHFDVPELLPTGDLRIETAGSDKALARLLAGQADVAVCWEPDVSRALANPGVVKILGTEDTERLIVDILVAGRRTLQKNPEVVRLLLENYFRVLKHYRSRPDLLAAHIRQRTGLPADAVGPMLKGVSWVNFNENCERWFGISAPGTLADEGLVNTIQATAKILENAGDFTDTPIPAGDPYRLINSAFLEEMFAQGLPGFTRPRQGPAPAGGADSLAARFPSLAEGEWDVLVEIGTLKVDPIAFQPGASDLDVLAKQVVDQAAERLRHYPNFRVVVKGHTDVRGDAQQNLRLSEDRADAVARYLNVVYGVDPNRMRVKGFGGDRPLEKRPGENQRAWLYRLPRVELVLVREDF